MTLSGKTCKVGSSVEWDEEELNNFEKLFIKYNQEKRKNTFHCRDFESFVEKKKRSLS